MTRRTGEAEIAEGIPEKHTRIIGELTPVHDAVREILSCLELDQPWEPVQVRLRVA